MFQSLHLIWKTLTKRSARPFIRGKDRKSRTSGRSLRFENCEDRRMLAAFSVDSVLDDGDGAKTTLREAVLAVNQSNDPENSITFDPAVFNTPQSINLTLGELDITKAVTIDAEGQDITIDAGGGTDGMVGNGDGFRIFDIRVGGQGTDADVTLRGLHLTGGDSTFGGGAIDFHEAGSVTGVGKLIVEETWIYDNYTSNGNGGAINVRGTNGGGRAPALEVIGSKLFNNKARFNGGAISLDKILHAEITSSEIRDNVAEQSGGGIYMHLDGINLYAS